MSFKLQLHYFVIIVGRCKQNEEKKVQVWSIISFLSSVVMMNSNFHSMNVHCNRLTRIAMTHIKCIFSSLMVELEWMKNETRDIFESRSASPRREEEGEASQESMYDHKHLFNSRWQASIISLSLVDNRAHTYTCSEPRLISQQTVKNRDRRGERARRRREHRFHDAEYVRNFPDALVRVNKLSFNSRKKKLNSPL